MMIRDILMKGYQMTVRPLAHAVARPINIKRINNNAGVILQMKNKHLGKRCFIIGNGPSLDPKDLDKLKNEICFGTNGIYNIYDKTNWRPTYYCVSDKNIIYKKRNIIGAQSVRDKFVGIPETFPCPDIHNVHYVKQIDEEFYPDLPEFSDDMRTCIYGGATVTYMCIQIAVYMGFKEIILLGVDHNYSITLNQYGKVERHDDIIDHFSDKDKIASIPSLYKTELAYKAAKKYADEHGIKIYNATRGGKLEVFERVDFDTLF